MPSYLANPGGILEVPLSLDNAAGLAAIQVQINFDPDVLELQTVAAGPLGGAFELSQGNGDGLVQLTFFRGEALAGGAGRLAVLQFRANPGAVTNLFSELAIADLMLSDSTGVIDLRQKDTLVTTNGQVAVTVQQNIDNARNGLPDWWELQHGLNPLAANVDLDPEHDGLPNLLEYTFGGNPVVADAQQRGIQPAGIARLRILERPGFVAANHRRAAEHGRRHGVRERARHPFRHRRECQAAGGPAGGGGAAVGILFSQTAGTCRHAGAVQPPGLERGFRTATSRFSNKPSSGKRGPARRSRITPFHSPICYRSVCLRWRSWFSGFSPRCYSTRSPGRWSILWDSTDGGMF